MYKEEKCRKDFHPSHNGVSIDQFEANTDDFESSQDASTVIGLDLPIAVDVLGTDWNTIEEAVRADCKINGIPIKTKLALHLIKNISC